MTEQRVANLYAFARLYGVVRWFHPSDAAAEADWDQLAIDGVRRVIDVRDQAELLAALHDVFSTIAPTVRIAASEDPSWQTTRDTLASPASAANQEAVAWQHKGYGDTSFPSGYLSKRRHRLRTIPEPVSDDAPGYVVLSQSIDATPLRGARVRFRGQLRTAMHGHGQLWLRIANANRMEFFDNMDDRPIASSRWRQAEIVAPVSAEATKITFGTLAMGSGITWYDDLEISTQGADGAWHVVHIDDPGFESGSLSAWTHGRPSGPPSFRGWQVTTDEAGPASGRFAARVEPAQRTLTEELFPEAPGPDEYTDLDLGMGFRARVPLVLPSINGHTLGDLAAQPRSTTATSPDDGEDRDKLARIADVIVAWNVLDHFWPYWELFPIDWTAQLRRSLDEALDDNSIDAHVATLRRLSAAAPDGHASTACPGAAQRAMPPIRFEVVEDQVLVAASADPAIARGDVVVSADGVPARLVIQTEAALTSGSPQLRAFRAVARFGAGAPGSTLSLRLRRGDHELDARVIRNDQRPEGSSLPPIARLDDGIYMIDMSRAKPEDIDRAIPDLVHAPGIVIDIRDVRQDVDGLLSHLITSRDDDKGWLAYPHVIRPDHTPRSIASWEPSGWDLPVLTPHLGGRIAFLIGPGTISYAESITSLVEHRQLGELVGTTTAGTNGNVAEMALPSDCRVRFTGMRATRRDGTRLHGVGVPPTIPVTRTIAGVRDGRDEVLDRAIARLRGQP